MAIEDHKAAAIGETSGAISSRRQALGAMLGAWASLPGGLGTAGAEAPLRLAISESLVTDVNVNDARAAMLVWIRRMENDFNVTVEIDPKGFNTTEEILRRARNGQFDCVALNVIEYRQIADVLDPSQILGEADATGLERYVLLATRSSGIQRLGELKGRRLCMLKAPKMCVATAWLATILDAGHYGPSEQFFASVNVETKATRVVLPVFFGQAEACLTSKRSFDTMCELNPQVAKDLTVIASSPAMVMTFYIFQKNYHGASRERFAKVCSDLPTSANGRQLAALFQFESLGVKDIGCLAPALAVLERAERGRSRPGAGSGKA